MLLGKAPPLEQAAPRREQRAFQSWEPGLRVTSSEAPTFSPSLCQTCPVPPKQLALSLGAFIHQWRRWWEGLAWRTRVFDLREGMGGHTEIEVGLGRFCESLLKTPESSQMAFLTAALCLRLQNTRRPVLSVRPSLHPADASHTRCVHRKGIKASVSRIDLSPGFTGQVYFSQESLIWELFEVIKENSKVRLNLENGPWFGFVFFFFFFSLPPPF